MHTQPTPPTYYRTDDYEIRVRYSVSHEAFIAQVAEMPGIVLQGRTAEAAVSEVRFVLGRIIETYARDSEPLPVPGDIPEPDGEDSLIASLPDRRARPIPPVKDLVIRAAASAFGRLGGSAKSPAKAVASRRNGALAAKYGKLGGRPKGSTKKAKAAGAASA